jgi:hypothetical protein
VVPANSARRGPPFGWGNRSTKETITTTWPRRLSERKFDLTSPELRANILDFYSDLSAPIDTKKDQDDWKSVLSELDQLKSMPPIPIAVGSLAQ